MDDNWTKEVLYETMKYLLFETYCRDHFIESKSLHWISITWPIGVMIETDITIFLQNFGIFELQKIFRKVVPSLNNFRRYCVLFSHPGTINIGRPIRTISVFLVLTKFCQHHDNSTIVLPNHIEKIIVRLEHGSLSNNEFAVFAHPIRVLGVYVVKISSGVGQRI
ncbi:unnamed protein product [Ichnoviriform fumiferanae]|uniref:Uncharacterized protein n=1 Tax=Ichnoviriform fumiferanae TaxID=419435 RepID=A2PZU3_9VIRU|nr:hypothetical protein GfIV_sB46gp2 [Ichnoviriform fumiferanae]BAF45515.1 unnamed protein product [Ichnoviriform fumiferanae]